MQRFFAGYLQIPRGDQLPGNKYIYYAHQATRGFFVHLQLQQLLSRQGIKKIFSCYKYKAAPSY